MASLRPRSVPARTAPLPRRTSYGATLAAIGFLLGPLPPAPSRSLSADRPSAPRRNPCRATTSPAARQSAVQSIPIEKLGAQARAKVASVLRKISVFRRMPVGVVDCDPELYLFLVRHPDVVVNIWEVLKISRLKLRQVGPDSYQVSESAGTLATVEFLYRSHDTHVLYAEGSYEGPLTVRPIQGRGLLILKSGYVRETNGRYYVTSRLDTFLRVEPAGAELLTKTFHPLVGTVADSNFLQTVAFVGSLSRTAERNSTGVQRLAAKLSHVQPQLRLRLSELAAGLSRQPAAPTPAKTTKPARVAARTDLKPKR